MKLRSIAPRSRRLCNRCGTRNRVAQPGCVILLCVLGERFVRRCRSFKNISSISTFRQRADKRQSHSRKYITEKGEKFGEIYFFFLPVRIIAIIYANSSRNFYTCRFTVYIANSSRRSCFGPTRSARCKSCFR